MTIAAINATALKAFIARVERLEAEKAAISEDIKAVYAEAKAIGYSPKIMRQVVKRRTQDPDKLAAQEAELELYVDAVGFGSLPLGKVAAAAEPSHDPETGEIIGLPETATESGVGPDLGETAAKSPHKAVTSRERPAHESQAKVEDEADGYGTDEPDADEASRPDARQSASTTSEHGRDGQERLAPIISIPARLVRTDDDMPDIPACLDRREKALESA